MSEEGSGPGGPGFPQGARRSAGEDVVEQDRRRFAAMNWRPSRGAALLGALGLTVGLAAGYVAGDRQPASGARPPQSARSLASAAAPVAPVATAVPVTPDLTQSTSACSAQIGHELQLGVQVTNQSGAAVTLHRVAAVLPMGGLKAVAQQWAPCGALQGSVNQQAGLLAPGASIWFTVTFKVLWRCPSPLPVEFTVAYDLNGQPVVAQLPGFSDLGEVPYTGCSTN